jgi:hypothetical protein
MGIKTMQNFTLISKLLRKKQKISTKKVKGQKKGAKLGIFLFYTTNLQKFLANNFFLVYIFSIISTDFKSARYSAYFEYSYLKK